MKELYDIFPIIWWLFIIGVLTAQLGAVIGILANIIDWIFKPKFLFFHVVANILWMIGFPLMIIFMIPILIDAYIYDFIPPF